MAIGPIQAFVIGFPDNDKFEGRIIEELGRLRDVGAIRVIDAVFVLREEGEINVVSLSDLDDAAPLASRSPKGGGVGGEIALKGEDAESRDLALRRHHPRRVGWAPWSSQYRTRSSSIEIVEGSVCAL